MTLAWSVAFHKIFTLYLLTFPTNYQHPRYEISASKWTACEWKMDDDLRGTKIYQIDFVTDKNCLGCGVELRVFEAKLHCAEPIVGDIIDTDKIPKD